MGSSKPHHPSLIVVLMGVSGSGKTTIGKLLAQDLGWKFYEGDDFHPQMNVDKMQRGIPLNDEDRVPWLRALRKLIHNLIAHSQRAVITCSALKQKYRSWLTTDGQDLLWVYLKGNYALIHERVRSRKEHFMSPNLLTSQFLALEEPQDILSVSIEQSPEDIVNQIKQSLKIPQP
jgi:gluconokinase